MFKIPTNPRKTMFIPAEIQVDFSARSGNPAPRFCPTKVAAALLIPQEGRIVNIRILIAMVYAAKATLPNSAIIRTNPIQLPVEMIN